jgi:iron(III) transport system substrate-binding protein
MNARRTIRRTLSTVVAGTLVLALAACGSSSGAADSGSQAQSAADKLTPSQLATEAAKEGTVVWYTTFADTDVQPIIKSFNTAYPNVKVDALRLSADKIPPRVITEQRGGKYNADVVSGDSPQIAQLLQAGALQPYAPVDAAPLPTGLALPDGYQGVVYAVTTVLAWNPSVLKQKNLTAPKTWQDLTQPQWKGQFSIDPGAVNWYDSLITSMGHDQALALLKGLGNNAPRFVESHTQALTNVQAGEPMAAATAYGYKASSLKKQTPDGLDFANGIPLPASLNLIDVVKSAPHPNAARLFDDWMVSKAGQQEIVQVTNHTSVRPDVDNDKSVWDPAKWTPAWGHPNLSQADYNTYLTEMKSALKAP